MILNAFNPSWLIDSNLSILTPFGDCVFGPIGGALDGDLAGDKRLGRLGRSESSFFVLNYPVSPNIEAMAV